MAAEEPIQSISDVLGILADGEVESSLSIDMTPSENRMSLLAKTMALTDASHRYFFNPSLADDGWNFSAARTTGRLESDMTIPAAKRLTCASHVNVRPLSGLNAMALVLLGVAASGDTIATVSPQQGGHYATDPLAKRYGLEVRHLPGWDPYHLDYRSMAAFFRETRPALVYLDQSHGLFPIDIRAIRSAIEHSGITTVLHADVSHWMGLVLGQALENPLEAGADSFGGSTHKTFPGPHHGLYATNRDDLAELVAKSQFYSISSHHYADVIALGVSMLEFEQCGGAEYARRVIMNAGVFARRLAERGLVPEAEAHGFTGGHQVWLRTDSAGIGAREASERLYAEGIRVNVLDDLPGVPGEALRIGVNEATYLGLSGSDILDLADTVADTILGQRPPARRGAKQLRHRASFPFRLDVGKDTRTDAQLARLMVAVHANEAKETKNVL